MTYDFTRVIIFKYFGDSIIKMLLVIMCIFCSCNIETLLAILFAALYYVDSLYEKVVKVDIADGQNPKKLMDNIQELGPLTVFTKRHGKTLMIILSYNSIEIC